jgi:hypothetical protein
MLLSGSEFPLRSADYIHEFFQAHRGTEFIDLVQLPAPAAGRSVAHLNTWWPPSTQPVRRFTVRALARCGLVRRDYRKHFNGLAPFGGHTWWALSREACMYIEAFVSCSPRVVQFFRDSAQPEEFFFHTILGNSSFRARVRRNLLFEDWSAGGSRPAMISETHLDRLESQPAVVLHDVWGDGEVLFARKFSDERLDLIDRLEAMIAAKDHGCRV